MSSTQLEIPEMLERVQGPNGNAALQIYHDYKDLIKEAPGSSRNHQAWPGGYHDHVKEVMNIADFLYRGLSKLRPLPFTEGDGLLVMFLHDLEKPFKYKIDSTGTLIDNPDYATKAARAVKRNQIIDQYGIQLDDQQQNAMKYVEQVRDEEYTNTKRSMGELATLCACADLISTRLWYNHPLPNNQDTWIGATRINPSADDIVLHSEISS